MNKKLILAFVGTALVAGCHSEVMSDRKYVPAPDAENPPAMETEAPKAPAVKAPAAQAPAPAKTTEFAPMTPAPAAKQAVSSAAPAGGTYVVKSGDTMGKIAAQHHVRLAALMQANNMTEEQARRLKIGQKLVIPSGKSAAASYKAPKGKSVRKPAKAAATVKADADGTYTVKSGDTPQKIAKKLGCKMSDLMKANNMTEEQARRLQIGQKLVVPGKGTAVAATAPAAPVEAAAAPVDAAAPADAAVAPAATAAPADAAAPAATAAPADAAATAADAAAATSTDILEVGADTTAAEIAKQRGITVEELCRLNTGLNPDASVKKGEVVFVPAAK